MKVKLPLALLGATLLVAAIFRPVQRADGQEYRPPIIIDPPMRPWPPRPWPLPERGRELRLLSQKANVTIQGPLAKIKLKQEFQNPTGGRIEGTYLFPLPAGAALSGFAMTVDGKRTEAEILESGKAREIYEGIVARLRDPAILEFTDRDLLRARIFPIAPGGKVEIELNYAQALRPEGASFRLTVPQKLPLGGSPASSSVEVDLTAAGLKGVYSPSHKVEIKRDGDKAHVGGEWNAAQDAAADFSLVYSVAAGRLGVSATVYRSSDEDPYFLLLAAPDAKLAPQEVSAKDVVFVFDTSGSMEGPKINQARKALGTLLGSLNPADRFGIVTFASDVDTFQENMVTATAPNVAKAREFSDHIKAIGGTNINDALQTALKMLDKKADRPQQIVFMTDGQPTVGETNLEQILKNEAQANSSHARIFVFGVGYDVNTRLLDRLADDNRGASDYVLPQEDIEEKVGALYSKIAYPVLSDPELHWTGATAYDVYPRHLPDLFKGSQIVVFGRLRNLEKPDVSLSGQFAGKAQSVDGAVGMSTDSSETVGRVWATRKIGYLLDDARSNNRTVDDEARAEIIKLSKRYGIVTPFTAGLITEDTPVTRIPGNPPPIPWRDAPIGPMAAPQDGRGAGLGGPSARFQSNGMAADSGAAGVAGSQSMHQLKSSERAVARDDIRTVAGKSFVSRHGVWTDLSITKMQAANVKIVKFASEKYFQLAHDAKVAKWLSLGERVVFEKDGQVWQIEP